MRSIVVQVGDHPLTDFWEVLILEVLDEFIYRDVRERCKNARVDFSSRSVPLTLVKDPTKVWEVL